MNHNCILKLLQYNVEKINFVLNKEFDYSITNIEVTPNFECTLKKIDECRAKIILEFIMKNSVEHPLPFDCNIAISGIFSCENWEENNNEIMKINSVSILFPFLRALIATITSNAAVPPYVLPVMNINALLSEQLEKQKSNK